MHDEEISEEALQETPGRVPNPTRLF